MSNASQVVKVGIFMTICLVILGWLILRVEDWRLWGPKGARVDAVFDSVVGLDDKAAVRLAGVRVGRVDEGAPLLPPGTVLAGKTPVSFDDAMAKIEEIGSSVQEFLGGGKGGKAGLGAGGGFSTLIDSIQATSDELRALIAEERFSETLARELPRITEQIARVLAQVEVVLAENRGNLKDSMANIKELTADVQTSVDNLNQITTRIASGEGTIGKLVNSPEAHDQLMSALGSVEKGVDALGSTLNRVNELELDLGLDGAYLSEVEDWRSAFRLDLLPHGDESDRYYRVELVSDPRGRISEKREIVTVTLPDGSTATTTTDRLTSETRRNNWSALFGLVRTRCGLADCHRHPSRRHDGHDDHRPPDLRHRARQLVGALRLSLRRPAGLALGRHPREHGRRAGRLHLLREAGDPLARGVRLRPRARPRSASAPHRAVELLPPSLRQGRLRRSAGGAVPLSFRRRRYPLE